MTTKQDSTNTENRARRPTLALVAAGKILPVEAARLAGVSRQRMNQWLRAADIDASQARDSFVQKLWRKHR
jgi:hypothetical protein